MNYGTQIIPPYLSKAPKTQISTLSNKIRVATENSGSELTTIGVWINAGSIYETDANNGVSHFLEHLAFKGTKQRGQKVLEDEVENLGASLNTYTSREQTVYVANCFKNDVPAIIDILSDILQNTNFTKENIEKERAVILKEKAAIEKNWEEVIFDYLHDVAFQGTPLQRTVIGTEENISKIQREDLINYIQTHYTGQRIVISAAGGVNHDEICKLTEKSFSSIKSSSNFDISSLGSFRYTGSSVHIRDDLMPLAHIAIAFKSVPRDHPDYIGFLLLKTMTGCWDRFIAGSKYLTSKLSEIIYKEELAHSYSTFMFPYPTTGLFGTYFVTDSKHADDCTHAILNEWQRIGKAGLNPGELDTAKNKLKASILSKLEATSQIAEEIGTNMISVGRRLEPLELFQSIDAITEKDISRIQDQYLYDTDPAVAAIGPLENFSDYNQIRGWTYWNRL